MAAGQYLTLVQQYEYALIMEKKDIPVVQVLDVARPPDLKSGPARARSVILGLFAGLMIAATLVYAEDRLKRGGALKPDYKTEYISKLKTKSLKLVSKK